MARTELIAKFFRAEMLSVALLNREELLSNNGRRTRSQRMIAPSRYFNSIEKMEEVAQQSGILNTLEGHPAHALE
jgi:hypothetical protein